jgi:hypothetical protein
MTAIAACIRYALIRTSINSIAGNYEPALVARAVEVGLWSPERALSVARRVPEASKRAGMVAAILGTGKLSPAQREEAEKAGLEAAMAVRYERWRAEELAALVPHLSGETKHQALQTKPVATRALRYEWQWAKAPAPHLSGEAKHQALQTGLAGAPLDWPPAADRAGGCLGPSR